MEDKFADSTPAVSDCQRHGKLRAMELSMTAASVLAVQRARLPSTATRLLHRGDKFFDRVDALLKIGLLLRGQLQLDDPLDAAGAQNDRHADIIAADAVLLVAIGGAGNQPLLVANDRFDHLRRGRGRRVVGAAGLQQADDLRAAVAGALDDLVQPLGIEQLRDRNAADRRATGHRHHRVAVSAHQQGRNVFDAHAQLHRQKRAIAGRVEHAGLAQHALRRKAGDLQHALHHRVERIADDDDDRVGARGFDLARRPSRRSWRWSPADRRGSCPACGRCRP